MSKKSQSRKTPKSQSESPSTQLWAVALIALVAVGAVAVIALASSSRNMPTAAPVTGDAGRYAGVLQGVDANGLPRLGDPAAPVIVTEISDFT